MKNTQILFAGLSALMVSAAATHLAAQAADQTSSTTSGASAPASEVVTMSQFEVTTTQGHGYAATNSAAAFKTNEEMINIPQGVVVVTKDFIDDLGTGTSSNVMRYFGVAAKFFGDNLLMRGSSLQDQPYVDEMPTHGFYSDTSVVDSYEIIKGPAQALYLGASISGVILKTTKKPLPFEQNIITASIDQWGGYRFTFDSTGPLGKIGETEIGFRLIGAYQNGNTYFTDGINSRDSIFPEFSAKYRMTTVRLYYELEDTRAQQGEAMITPDGKLYTGSGWRVADNRMPDYAPSWLMSNVSGEVLQKLSESWELRISGAYWKQKVYGKYPEPTLANFDNRTETWINLVGNERWDYWTTLTDAQGHYSLGPTNWEMGNRDNFGYNFSVWTDKQAYWQTAPFPYPNGPIGGKYVVPFGQAASIPLAPPSAFGPPTTGTFGAYNTVSQDSIYWQHEIDIIPNWLTLLAGYTWANIDTEQVPNWGTLPYAAVHTPGQQWVHRLGAVVHITKEVSIYALDSTNFATPLGTLLENGQLAPNQVGTGTEVGLKWNFLGGRISGEAASYRVSTTNSVQPNAGFLPNGTSYGIVIGTTVLQGVDGDFAFQLLPGWQLIGSWYAGHDVQANGAPVSLSWNNSIGLFSRYDFSREGTLKGLAIGAGMNRLGGRWIATSGVLVSSTETVPAFIKLQTGTEVEAFLEYRINRHWSVTVNCDNILDEAYVVNNQTPLFNDPSSPTTFSFSTTFKF